MSHRPSGYTLVGYGGIGKVHAFGYQNLHFLYSELPLQPRPRWVAVGRPESCARAQAEGGFPRATTNYIEAVTDPDVDFVDCCTPNHLHAPVVMAALKAGKHVYCEKPLALNVADARAMLEAADQAQVYHQVAFNYRFIPAVMRARQLIAEGRIGDIYGFRFLYLHSSYIDKNRPLSWRLQKATGGSGALGDLGSHVLDMSRFLLGDYAAVLATTHTYIRHRPLPGAAGDEQGLVDVDDMFLCQVRLANGALGTVEASRLATGSGDDLRFEIHGSRGALQFQLMEPNWLHFFDAGAPGDPIGGERGYTRIETACRYPAPAAFPAPRSTVGWLRFHMASQYDFLCRMAGKKAIGATFVDGLRVQEIIAAIELSSEQGRWVTMAPVAADTRTT